MVICFYSYLVLQTLNWNWFWNLRNWIACDIGVRDQKKKTKFFDIFFLIRLLCLQVANITKFILFHNLIFFIFFKSSKYKKSSTNPHLTVKIFLLVLNLKDFIDFYLREQCLHFKTRQNMRKKWENFFFFILLFYFSYSKKNYKPIQNISRKKI